MNSNRFRDWYRSGADRPLILAHRGDSFGAPENTLEAARLGFENGADGWELDVRLTRDGVPVVIHDESLLRTTNVARAFEGDPRGNSGFLIGEFTLDEVRTLDAGSWFVDPEGGPRSAAGFGTFHSLPAEKLDEYASGTIRIPTLAEALDLTNRLDWMVNVEIKSTTDDPNDLVEAVLSEVRASKSSDRVTISSFELEVVALVASRAPEVATGALIDGTLDESAKDLLVRLGADAIHAPPFSVHPKKSGVPVLVYTVNDAGPGGLATQLIEEGVSGLFTDDPASMAVRVGIIPSSRHTKPRWGTAEHLADGHSDEPTPPRSKRKSLPGTR